MRCAGLLMLGTCVVARPAAAQLVSPGPLSTAHSAFDGTTQCAECHELAAAKPTYRCLSCHAHAPLRKAINDKSGLHATFKEPCRTCHTEHKGPKAEIIDWQALGGRSGFNHSRTGFPLAGSHEKVMCTACHKTRLRSGRTSYTGLSPSCAGCHKNPHNFTDTKLRGECALCHVTGGVAPKAMTVRQVPFSHAEHTGVPLVGRHARQRCVKCHPKGNMSMEVRRTCKDCHRSKHGKVYRAHACTECHNPVRRFRSAEYAHTKGDFRLEGKHAKTACAKCHKKKDDNPAKTCDSCHRDPHRKRFEGRTCAECHATGAVVNLSFNHATATPFALNGKHAKSSCRSCHRGKKPREFEKFPNHECQDCHAHTKAHNGQFADRKCTECHRDGEGKLVFDHTRDARFKLPGRHLALYQKHRCRKCHKAKVYRTEQLTCDACHKDPHGGQLGAVCDRCHDPAIKFAKIQFDHDRLARFPLEARHAEVKCEKCHPGRQYKTNKLLCFDCHGEKDPHQGKLGRACEKCHVPDKGAPKFAHDTMTSFALTGSHNRADCSFCHRPQPADGPPRVGWTRAEKPRPFDKTVPVMGKVCAECHFDVHEGRMGSACESCHSVTEFKNVSATVHDTGAFRLSGVHETLPCASCHTPGRLLGGLGEMCQTCHWDDDAHRNGLGPFCGECHQQRDWMRVTFSHLQTAWPLRGAHRTAPCRGCHGVGTYQGTPTECEFCHQADAARVADPLHTAELQPCERCHFPAGFIPARRSHPTFALTGQHNFVTCRNCHPSGVYVGTVDVCEGCHMADYTRARNPNHVADGYPTTCDDCHTPIGWSPATAFTP